MGLLRGVARTAVVAGTATAVSNRVSRRQAGRWAAQEQQQYESQTYQQQQYAPSSSGGGGSDNTIDQLRQLADLKSQGVLSDAEFEAQKARILNS
jgi:putative oligomerization/nucleic acid binding protein